MKFACGKKRDERRKAQQEWHQWFAWVPVKVGVHDCRWLEVVERKRTEDWRREYYIYRSLDSGRS